MQSRSNKMTYQTAFKNFMDNNFESAVDSATQASFSGSGYSVELFEDGTYRVLWNNQIGKLYDSKGIILGIPTLGDEEYDEDPDLCFYDNAQDAMVKIFEQAMADLREYA